jgi:hypothetical protein
MSKLKAEMSNAKCQMTNGEVLAFKHWGFVWHLDFDI